MVGEEGEERGGEARRGDGYGDRDGGGEEVEEEE